MNAPVSDRLRYHPLIEDALLLLTRDAARDKDRRQNFITDKETTSLDLDANGVGDLSTLIASDRVLPECIRYAEMYDPSNLNPLVQRQQISRPGNYDRIYLHFRLDGTKIRTQSIDNNVTPLVGPLSCALVRWVTLAQLAESEVEQLVEKAIELLAENFQAYEAGGDNE